MAETIPRCVNHPDVETRISCTSCGDPICTRCMRQGAVGQKCPACAKLPLSARGLGKPQHYVRGIAAGLAVAVVGGVLAWFVRGAVPFSGFLVPLALGYAIGSAIGWAVHRQTTQPFVTMAAVIGGIGGLVSYQGLLLLTAFTFHPWALLGIGLTALFSVTALRR